MYKLGYDDRPDSGWYLFYVPTEEYLCVDGGLRTWDCYRRSLFFFNTSAAAMELIDKDTPVELVCSALRLLTVE
jgi:hypothetical protein